MIYIISYSTNKMIDESIINIISIIFFFNGVLRQLSYIVNVLDKYFLHVAHLPIIGFNI